jgi:threonine dehydratase
MRERLRIPTTDEIVEAYARISPPAIQTPLLRFDADPVGSGDEWSRTPRDIFLKLETAQPIGSFKIRGAANAMATASAEALAKGVWTASAGNMAQGVAWVARERGIPCRVVVPDQAPRTKTDAIAKLDAELVKVSFDEWWLALLKRAHPGMEGLLIHPFADTQVMAGNGTIGLEIAAAEAELDAVLVPWGGGGLAIGIASALKLVSPRTKVYAVEVETAAPLTTSIAAGEPRGVDREKSFIDGMGSDRVSDEMWPLVRDHIAGTVVVTVRQVARALKLLVEKANVTAEGAGAATVAAALGGRLNGIPGARLDAQRVVCVISGGNIDPEVLATIMRGEIPH